MGASGRWWALAATVLALAVSAPPASAAFPGANGQLAVTPVSGSGVILASPQTGRTRRVCDAPQRCGGQPTEARFSPNGREIVLRNAAGRLEVTTMTGTCVWCLTSLPHVTIRGGNPAFTPDGTAVTYVHDGLWEVTPGSPHPTRLRVLDGPVTAAVWSASGRPVVVRRGWLWTGMRKADNVVLFTRLARGSAPAWSPDGRELVFTHGGFVSTMRIRNHKIIRIARGSSPTFSPDGLELAYLNRDHQVTLRPLGHGPARTLTKLRGRSLDWQPVTTITKRGCAAANGVVVARNGAATIRSSADTRQSHIGWNGCLNAVGIPFHLNGALDGDGYSLALGHVALAGDYAALQFIYMDKYMNYSDTVNVYDLRSGALVHTGAVACGGLPCNITGLTVNADGFAAWHAYDTPHAPESPVDAVSCPSPSLCVAGDNAGDVLVSTDPTAGRTAWTLVQLSVSSPGAITGVSCPTVSFCVAVDIPGDVFWSTDPTGGPGAWHANTANVATGMGGVSCASPTLCVAVGGETAYTSTDPAAAVAWRATPLRPIPDVLTGVACPSTTLCVVASSAGQVLTSRDPGDPSPAWTPPTSLPGAAGVDFVSGLNCPTTGLCAAVTESNSGDKVFLTTDPAAGGAAWTAQPVSNPVWVSCAGPTLCLALAGANPRSFRGDDAVTSTDPTDAAPTWSTTTALPAQPSLVTCPTTSLCVAFDRQTAVTSSAPTGATSAWTSFLADALPCDPATPCRAEALQALDDHGVHTLDTAPQGSGTVISAPTLSPGAVSWTHAGSPESATLP